MFVIAFSLAWVVGMAAWVIVMAHRHRPSISCAAGMMIAMAVAMMASLLFGLIWGYLLQAMAIPSIMAMGLGMMVGFTVGKPFHWMAVLDGMLAGIMGGMMGAMLGVMVLNDQPLRVISFCSLAYIAVMLVVLRLIKEERGSVPSSRARIRDWVISASIGWIALLTLVVGEAIDTDRSVWHVLTHWESAGTESVRYPTSDHHHHSH